VTTVFRGKFFQIVRASLPNLQQIFHILGAPKNNNPLGKIADFFAKFTVFIEED